ncbi:2-dehydro-3-deoxygluconokinase [Compostibacillus humi]|uniref:2-dehydro-3-deoxygluconokinase n=1 Tax=Compostibacillus humi TaxID=1245525 RepID=A0A8J3EIX3_9BACI|nr:sugar kinase [Compostibacillus humi]GGH68075.1 2-dehydro-3-deoxygluconokinase [Compostibacillus humi]
MDVVTIGETMVLFTPQSQGQMRYATNFNRKFAGAETNVAIGLAKLGHKAGWISRVGNDEFGKAMVSFVKGEGVDVSQVQYDREAPTGLFFKEIRTMQQFRIQYYRNGSAASRMSKEDINENYLKQAKILYISGITPALSESCYEMIVYAAKLAKKHGLTVVFDPNVRRNLWSEEKARKVLLELVSYSDIVLPSVEEGEFLFGTKEPEEIGSEVLKRGASMAVIKVGSRGAWYVTKDKQELVPTVQVSEVKDPVGAGDGFCAGFLSGLLDGLSVRESVARGNLVGSIVVQVDGDVEGLPDREELGLYTSAAEDIRR